MKFIKYQKKNVQLNYTNNNNEYNIILNGTEMFLKMKQNEKYKKNFI